MNQQKGTPPGASEEHLEIPLKEFIDQLVDIVVGVSPERKFKIVQNGEVIIVDTEETNYLKLERIFKQVQAENKFPGLKIQFRTMDSLDFNEEIYNKLPDPRFYKITFGNKKVYLLLKSNYDCIKNFGVHEKAKK